ncbi:MAG: transposase [Gemmataceae bacterium]|nr:transposase [Gemmataceae bacterium]
MNFPEIFRRRRLPHWDVPGAVYFVTACLLDSIPAQGLLDLDQYRRKLLGRRPPTGLTAEEWKAHQWKLTFARADDWLDTRPACRDLADPRLAASVVESMAYFAGDRYDVYAFVVMPSHFHWVFRPIDSWVASLPPDESGSHPLRTPRERIMHSIKRHSGRRCNELRGTQGAFWQDESYDHCVFDVEELGRIIDYVEQNPVRAGLVRDSRDWAFSSAKYRLERAIAIDHPLGRWQ